MRLGCFKVAKTRDVFRTMQGWKLLYIEFIVFACQIPDGLDFETILDSLRRSPWWVTHFEVDD